jgi:hypothetical protein
VDLNEEPNSSEECSVGNSNSPILKKGKEKKKKVPLAFFLKDIQKDEVFNKTLSALEERQRVLNRNIKLISSTFEQASRSVSDRLMSAWKSHKALKGTAVAYDDWLLREEATSIQEAVHLPKLLSPINGIVLDYKSGIDVKPDYYLRLSAFADRHPADFVWYAPMDALKEGKVQPLSQQAESFLVKNMGRKGAKLSSLNRTEKEFLAWRWLIISHNHTFADDRVQLSPRLSVSYERRMGNPKPPAAPISASAEREALTDVLKQFINQLPKPPPVGITLPEKTYLDFIQMSKKLVFMMAGGWCTEGVDGTWSIKNPDRKDDAFTNKVKDGVNSWLTAVHDLGTGKEQFSTEWYSDEKINEAAVKFTPTADNVFMRRSNPFTIPPVEVTEHQPSVEEEQLDQQADSDDKYQAYQDKAAEEEYLDSMGFSSQEEYDIWVEQHPESFDKDGHVFYRDDIDLLDVSVGQTFLVTFHNGVEYRAVTGSPTGPVKSEKAKGKTPTREVDNPAALAKKVPVPKEETGQPSTPSSKKKVGKAKKEGGQAKGSDKLTEDNPLRVRSEPKSKALSNDQRKALRSFFHLEESLVPADEWKAMSSKDKAKALKARSLPRWATDAVLRHPDNLEMILKGKLTKDNRNVSIVRAAPPNGSPRAAQAMEAWQKLKGDFDGVTLFREPHTSKEKAFKKRFDQLVSDYGKQSCFPKLRERPDRQSGGSRNRSVSSSRGGELSGLIDIAKAVGEIARAFSGR